MTSCSSAACAFGLFEASVFCTTELGRQNIVGAAITSNENSKNNNADHDN